MKRLLTLIILLAPLTVLSQFQKDLSAMVKANSEKVISLAEAIPESDYSWSPAEGIRDVKGVVLHIVGANYFFPSVAGVEVPEGIDPRNLDNSIDSKEAAIKILKESYEHMMGAINSVPDAKLNETFDFYGTEMTIRQALLLAYGHCEEHMGQLIAYARSNNIAPPWSQSE